MSPFCFSIVATLVDSLISLPFEVVKHAIYDVLSLFCCQIYFLFSMRGGANIFKGHDYAKNVKKLRSGGPPIPRILRNCIGRASKRNEFVPKLSITNVLWFDI